MDENILEVKEITKKYPGNTALKKVSFSVKRGTVHCLVGENGAGKSTLIKILSGVEKRTEGTIFLEGREYAPSSARQALEHGMSVLFQELNVVEQLTVEQNMTLGTERSRFGILRKDEEKLRRYEEVLHELDPTISMSQEVSTLSVGKRQLIQIAKAIAANAKILIMDEPTAALSEDETRRLFAAVETLKKKGLTILFVSHKMEELFQIGEYITVLVNGEMVTTRSFEGLTQEELVKLMLGKVVAEHYEGSAADESAVALEARDICTDLLKHISFQVKRGEIFGFYGLMGAGKTEIARAIAGIDRYRGKFYLSGRELDNRSMVKAYKNGICIVPEERRTQGAITLLSIRENITLTNPARIMKHHIRSRKLEKKITDDYIERLGIACQGSEQGVQFLSGGNQQKVVLAKCLNSEFQVMLLDEPTRGVDIGAKKEIHNIARDMARQGKTIIVFSSELPEVLNLCDRIAVLYEGSVKQIVKNDENLMPEQIMNYALGVKTDENKNSKNE